MSVSRRLKAVHREIEKCRKCPAMCSGPVHGPAVESPVMLLGQAPGVHEESLGRPFAYTAGKTLFRWFSETSGVDEETFRSHVYMAAVARCYPGKNGKGDRIPDEEEIANCREHLQEEVRILKPRLIIAVGRVAIKEVLGEEKFSAKSTLNDVVGRIWKARFLSQDVDVVCLPHPSGRSTWHVMEPGKSKLKKALKLICSHPQWKDAIG